VSPAGKTVAAQICVHPRGATLPGARGSSAGRAHLRSPPLSLLSLYDVLFGASAMIVSLRTKSLWIDSPVLCSCAARLGAADFAPMLGHDTTQHFNDSAQMVNNLDKIIRFSALFQGDGARAGNLSLEKCRKYIDVGHVLKI
jgi:hypothetical protein